MDPTRLLRELVAIPSVNPMGRTLDSLEVYEGRLTDYLEQFFRGLGVDYERQPVAEGRENIIARYDSPGATRTILLEVHQDTVPADQMAEPFSGRLENGRVYGRGACDVKGGMAAMLMVLARLVRERPARSAHVILACTVDEEHTNLGVRALMEAGMRADMAVVAEPTGLDIIPAHKGIARWHLSTRGRSCHSSTPEQGTNAVYRMAGVLIAIEQYAEALRTGRADALLGAPTLSVGRIEGGSGVNTVPDWCRIDIDRRLIPGESAESARADLVEYLKEEAGVDFPIEISEPWLQLPALEPAGNEEAIQRLGRAIDGIRGDHRVGVAAYGTDASTIQSAGIPAVVFGPGDIAQAHTADEWISVEQVEQATAILGELIRQE